MKVVDVIAEILKREGVEFLSCYPTNTLIEAAASAGIRPIVCRQERVGVGIADGFTRVTNGKRIGVFTMQAGPGAENAFSGITTAYSDSVPILLLPVGHARDTSQVFHFFRSVQSYAPVTKWTEEITLAHQVPDIMRRAFSYLKMGRLGPVLVEIPNDAAIEEFPAGAIHYVPVKSTASGANARDVSEAAKVLVQAKAPVIVAGQGVLYAEASNELVELAELLQAPVTTPLEGKSSFPEHHPLSLGTGAGVMPKPVHTFLQKADVIFAVGASLTKHSIVAAPIPSGKTIIHATNDERDINKHYPADYPILGDAKPVLRQFIDAVKDELGNKNREANGTTAEIMKGREEWMAEWMEPFARTIDAAKKYVVSNTLPEVDWNAELLRGDLAQAVEKLKREPGKGVFVGGVTLPLALAELGLIDEYEFVVHPRVAGHGPTLLAGLSKHLDLKLVSRREFGSGAVALRYELRK